MTFRALTAALIAATLLSFCGISVAQEPGWSMAVNPLSDQAQQIRQQDMLDRPYRPGHFYGNTVRRMHYRGHPFPVPVYRSGGGFRR